MVIGEKNVRGFNLIFILLLGALLLMVWSSSMNQMQDNYTRGALEKDLAEGNVSSAVISQNKETPTGSVTVMLKGGDSSVYLSDVVEAQEQLKQRQSITPCLMCPKKNYVYEFLLPVILVGRRYHGIFLHDEYAGKIRRRGQCQNDEFWQEQGQNERGQ